LARILSVSDKVIPFIYSPTVKEKFGQVDLVIGCGDLPYYYQEYIISCLDVPLFFVRGNHDPEIEYREHQSSTQPLGGINLHGKTERYKGLTFAGIEGCIRYKRDGVFLYTQREMWGHVFSLIPGLILSKIRTGRFLDIFVTHAPPWGIHDKDDLPHQGVKAFRWLLEVFKPEFHFHGHVHLYRSDTIRETLFHNTRVINTYGYLETKIK
jgi:Icc-related predicted phosphoesterase